MTSIVVTLRVNEPANQVVRGWSPTDPAPDGRQEVRARWDRAHAVRRGLVALAAVTATGGLLGGR